jgi:hypothetical protein
MRSLYANKQAEIDLTQLRHWFYYNIDFFCIILLLDTMVVSRNWMFSAELIDDPNHRQSRSVSSRIIASFDNLSYDPIYGRKVVFFRQDFDSCSS